MDKAAFNFNKWNTITGWFTFGVALLTYTLTVETHYELLGLW